MSSRATRSFLDNPGFMYSSFTSNRPDSRSRRSNRSADTTGVLPIVSSTLAATGAIGRRTLRTLCAGAHRGCRLTHTLDDHLRLVERHHVPAALGEDMASAHTTGDELCMQAVDLRACLRDAVVRTGRATGDDGDRDVRLGRCRGQLDELMQRRLQARV